MLRLRKELLAVEEDRNNGVLGYPVDEVVTKMRNAINADTIEAIVEVQRMKKVENKETYNSFSEILEDMEI